LVTTLTFLKPELTRMQAPRIQGLCPLIQVFDMPASLRFYRDALGFEIVQQSSPGDHCDWVWLRRDNAELMLNTMFESDSRPDQPDAVRSTHHGDTAFFLGTPDVDSMVQHLRECGIECEPPIVTPYGMKQAYAKDPDGYTVCFQWTGSQSGNALEPSA
jgi:catechol 2,3-dioxygenase-like lactoylglutathione lyase family enzyme